MRAGRDRWLAALALGSAALALSACQGSAPVSTTGGVGATLAAADGQYTLTNVVSEPDQDVVAAELSVRNTTAVVKRYSMLGVVSLLSDSTGRSHSPESNPDALVPGCGGTGFALPLPPGGTQQGCEYFSVPRGATPARLELLVRPTLHWTIGHFEQGVGGVSTTIGSTGQGSGKGSGTGSGTSSR